MVEQEEANSPFKEKVWSWKEIKKEKRDYATKFGLPHISEDAASISLKAPFKVEWDWSKPNKIDVWWKCLKKNVLMLCHACRTGYDK